MLTPSQAEKLIGEHMACLPIESLPVGYSAGAILRENVYAERDQPPFDRITMDGIALSSSAVRAGQRRLRILGLQAAGDPPLTLDSATGCIEAMTGAMLPVGCDAVVPVEQITVQDGYATLEDGLQVEPGQNIHHRGSDQRQGALLLRAGVQLEAPDIAVAAAELGYVRDPLAASLRRRGFQRVADDHIVDDAQVLQARLKRHLNTYEVLILSGGVSMGKLDLVPAALAACGVQQVFHKIAQRPGKPMWFGSAPNGSAVFALPGNPVSTLVCLARYVIPALSAAMGASPGAAGRDKIALAAPVTFNVPLAGFVPVRVETDDWGRPWALASPHNGSGDFAALAGTDGFVELPPGPNVYPKGFVTRLYRW